MVPFAIAISAGILFLLRALIAFWTETKRTHNSNVQIRSKSAPSVMSFRAADRPSATPSFEERLKNAANAANEADDRTSFHYVTH